MDGVIERAMALLVDLDAEGDVERGEIIRDLLAEIERLRAERDIATDCVCEEVDRAERLRAAIDRALEHCRVSKVADENEGDYGERIELIESVLNINQSRSRQ